ncbi:hypothetical protein NX059_003118 [Plenodomus lindquistii]|nr:hypothetical protein NX059_003118 [Plenodomus lindquistii]
MAASVGSNGAPLINSASSSSSSSSLLATSAKRKATPPSKKPVQKSRNKSATAVDDSLGDNNFDGDKEAVYRIDAHTAVNIPDHRLLNSAATTDAIIQDIAGALPALAVHHPDIAKLIATARAVEKNSGPPVLPVILRDPQTWASSDAIIDQLWLRAIFRESRLPADAAPAWFNLDSAHLVKPYGTFKAPLIILCSYPTLDEHSTIHPRYATSNDMSNMCIFSLHARLGFHCVSAATPACYSCTLFPDEYQTNSGGEMYGYHVRDCGHLGLQQHSVLSHGKIRDH